MKNTQTKHGRINQMEKYQIQGMLQNKIEIAEIAKQLGRSEGAVQRYVDGELDRIHTTVANTQLSTPEGSESPVNEALEDIKSGACAKINAMGAVEGMAHELVDRALAKHDELPANVDVLVGWAFQDMKAKELMIRRTAGKNERTVSIMTGAASERSDEARKNMPKTISRTARHNIFSIKDNKMLGE